MSATTTPTTFSDLYTDCANRLRVSVSDTTTLNILKRYVNKGLHDLHIQQNWPWAERRATLNTHAVYSTGTVSISTSTRTTLTGTNTLWTTAVTGMGFNNARAGGKVVIGGDTEPYTVSSVDGAGTITLGSRWVGQTSLTNTSYTYLEDEYALESDFWRLVDARKFSDAMVLPVLTRQEFYRQYPRNTVTGKPRVCTILELGPGTTVAARPRVLLHPAPDQVYNIPYRYITTNLAVESGGTGVTNLANDTDEPIIPLRYRHVIVFYAIAQWYRDRKDDARWSEANGEYVDLVRRMAGDTSTERDRPLLSHNRRAYLRGTSGYSNRGGRYSTGTWFDEGRDIGY